MSGGKSSKKTSATEDIKLDKIISGAISLREDKFFVPDEDINIDRFIDIMERDGKVRQAVDLPVNIALNNWIGYKHPEPSVDEFVKELIFKKLNLKKIMYSICSARWTGVSVSYVVKDLEEGKMIIRDIITLPPTSFIPGNGIGEKHVKIESKEGEDKTYPIEDFIIYRHGDTFREPYGVSILSYVFRHWGRKEECVKAWLGFLQKCGIPTRILYVEPDCPEDEKQALLQALIDSQYEMAMVVPRDVDDGKPTKELQFIEANKSAADFADFFEKMDREIFTCLGIPELLYNASSGTYSLGLVQEGTFMKEVHKAQDMLQDILNNQVLAPIIFANFGVEERGEMFFKTTDGREWKEELEAALSFLGSELREDGDEQYFRTRLGLKPADKEGGEKTRKDDGGKEKVKEDDGEKPDDSQPEDK